MTGKTKVDYTASKQEAIEQFRRRRQLAANMEKVDNSALHAGAPMYFYCRHCGLPTEMLPEDYVFPPITECSQCRGLRNENWLEEAVRAAGE
jgi:hypothetical protein